MRRHLLPFLLCGALLAAGGEAPAPPPDAPKADPKDAEPPPTKEKIKAHLARLGDEEFQAREDATQALLKLGAPARNLIRQHAEAATDAEVKLRCAQLLDAIAEPARTAEAMLKLLEKSKLTIRRPGATVFHTFTGPQFANHLRLKAAAAKFSTARPAVEFIDAYATTSSSHGGAYVIVLEDGKETPFAPWIKKELKQTAAP
ncbi:MAG: DUF5329 family protein [Planctomycetota bacterium]|nr:DUF5329 family protein [Planctomycetota bacterium]